MRVLRIIVVIALLHSTLLAGFPLTAFAENTVTLLSENFDGMDFAELPLVSISNNDSDPGAKVEITNDKVSISDNMSTGNLPAVGSCFKLNENVNMLTAMRSAGKSYTLEAAQAPGRTGKALKMTTQDISNNCVLAFVFDNPLKGKVVFEVDLYSYDNAAGNRMIFLDSNSKLETRDDLSQSRLRDNPHVKLDKNLNATITGGSSLGKLQAQQWYTVKIAVDTVKNECNAEISDVGNGTFTYTGNVVYDIKDGISCVGITDLQPGSQGVYIDNIKINSIEANEYPKTDINYNCNTPSDVTVDVPSDVKQILYAGLPLDSNTDYTVNGNGTVTLKKEMLSGLPTRNMLETDFYTNMLNADNLADPNVLFYEGVYYVFGTGFRTYTSTDLVNWEFFGSVSPKGSWGDNGFWAPEVYHYNDKFYMYYSAKPTPAGGPTGQIGLAIADHPTGPYVDIGVPVWKDFPMIDAHVFFDDDGKNYLYVSRQASGNTVNGKNISETWGVELASDMKSVIGKGVLLSKPEQQWELASVSPLWNEGPEILKHNGKYYLMYSANNYGSNKYSVGYAVSDNPLGPFVKYENNPVLSAEEFPGRVSGTGHHFFASSLDGKENFIVYHSHVDVVNHGQRGLNIDRMGFREDGTIYVNGPTINKQPMPSGTGDWTNIAGDAVLTTSPTKSGYSEKAPTDGEIGIYKRNEKYEWVAADKSNAKVRLTWDKEQQVGAVLIYGSAMPQRKIKSGRLTFSDGTSIDAAFSQEPDMGAQVIFEPKKITWVEFEAVDLAQSNGEAGISEIMVLGHDENGPSITRNLLLMLEDGHKEVTVNYVALGGAPVTVKPNDEHEISVILNGKKLSFDQPPIIVEDRTLVPMRKIFEELGAEVEWDAATNTVTAKKDSDVIILTIGEKDCKINGKIYNIDVPAQVVNDRTLVPIRFVSEALLLRVTWNDATKTVKID